MFELLLLISGTHKIWDPVSNTTLNFWLFEPISISAAKSNEYKRSILALRVVWESDKKFFIIIILKINIS